MQKKQNHFAVFLDVDGVLNTETTCKKTRMDIRGLIMHEWKSWQR